MPRKGKNPPHVYDPATNKLACRNRAQQMKINRKKSKWFLKQQNQAQSSSTVSSAANYDEDGSISLSGGEENELENVTPPRTEPSAFGTLGQQVNKANGSSKARKKKTIPQTSSNDPSALGTLGQQAKKETIPPTSSNDPSTSCTASQQVSKQNERQNSNKKLRGDSASQEGKPQMSSDLTILKDKAKSKKLGSSVAGTQQDIRQNYSGEVLYEAKQDEKKDKAEKREHVDKQTRKPIQNMGFSYNDFNSAPPEARKAVQDLNYTSSLLQNRVKKIETSGEPLRYRDKLIIQSFKDNNVAVCGNIRVIETEKSDQKSDEEMSMKSYKVDGNTLLQIRERNVSIDIIIGRGIQVLCNKRRRSVNDLVSNVESSTASMQNHATARPEKDIKTDTEKRDETTIEPNVEYCSETLDVQAKASPYENVKHEEKLNKIHSGSNVETCSNTLEVHSTKKLDEDISVPEKHAQIPIEKDIKTCSDTLDVHSNTMANKDINDKEERDKTVSEKQCNSGSVSKFSSENCQTVVDQATNISDKNIRSESQQYGNSETETICDSITGEFSEGNNSCNTNSVLEDLQTNFDDYLQDIESAYTKCRSRVENYIKGKLLKPSEI